MNLGKGKVRLVIISFLHLFRRNKSKLFLFLKGGEDVKGLSLYFPGNLRSFDCEWFEGRPKEKKLKTA